VAVVDGLFSEAALQALVEFARTATVFHRGYIQGYVGAFLTDGLGASAAVLQAAAELQAAFPRLLEGLTCAQAWVYKYAEAHERGIDAHADQAAVSVNVWLAADASNRDPASGGLLIFEKEPPPEWSFHAANTDSVRIEGLLGDAGVTVVPHRCNRAVFFKGNKFHKTDTVRFKDGYENRRINLTFLFNPVV
jgi:hypothetical protein